MVFVFFIFLIFLSGIKCERLTVCCTGTTVNLRDAPCGNVVGTAKKDEYFERTGNTASCNSINWWEFTTGEWASSSYFSGCVELKNVCTPSSISLLNGPCGTSVYQTQAMEKFRTTGDFDDSSCSKSYIKLDNGYWVEESNSLFQKCYSKAIRSVTLQDFISMFPGLKQSDGEVYHPFFNEVLTEGEIITCDRLSSFIAQIGHESGSLKYWEELASGEAYNNRADLCNGPTDGPKYKGRGPIQLTGKCNYRAASTYLFGTQATLENDPYQVGTCDASSGCLGFRTTNWYWQSRNLNFYSDYGNQVGFDVVTKKINGGYNGKADRDKRWKDARLLLECDSTYSLTDPLSSTTNTGQTENKDGAKESSVSAGSIAAGIIIPTVFVCGILWCYFCLFCILLCLCFVCVTFIECLGLGGCILGFKKSSTLGGFKKLSELEEPMNKELDSIDKVIKKVDQKEEEKKKEESFISKKKPFIPKPKNNNSSSSVFSRSKLMFNQQQQNSNNNNNNNRWNNNNNNKKKKTMAPTPPRKKIKRIPPPPKIPPKRNNIKKIAPKIPPKRKKKVVPPRPPMRGNKNMKKKFDFWENKFGK